MAILVPRKIEIILEVCAQLAEQENLTETVQAAAIIGLSSIAGGFLGGRNGFLIGGAIGTAINSMVGHKTIAEIIREGLTDKQKRMLYELVKELLLGIAITSVKFVLQSLVEDPGLKEKILSTLMDFVKYTVQPNIVTF